MRRCWPVLLLLLSLAVRAQDNVALIDRALSPDALTSHPGFDQASRHEILAFASELLQIEWVAADDWPHLLGLAQVDMLALERYRNQTWLRLFAAYNAASHTCHACAHPKDLKQFRQLIWNGAPKNVRLSKWQLATQHFHSRYLHEQLRLAAQARQPDADEAEVRSGFELMDGEFLLSFDGGPDARGHAQRIAHTINKAGQNAVFFFQPKKMQGHASLGARQINDIYGDNCVALQGLMSDQQQIERSSSLLSLRHQLKKLGRMTWLTWYRPEDYTAGKEGEDSPSERQVLWNIDSLDNLAQLNGQQITDRVLTLMLLWRKGIIRYHDQDLRSAQSINQLLPALQGSPVRWVDCRSFADH